MKQHQWDALELGDIVKNVDDDPNKSHLYQVIQIQGDVVYVLRQTARGQVGGFEAVQSETVAIKANSDTWLYVRKRTKLTTSGGFTVTRADGSTEYEPARTPRQGPKKEELVDDSDGSLTKAP